MGISFGAKVGKKASISARVYRAKTQTWEDIGIIASNSRWWNFKNSMRKMWRNLWLTKTKTS